MLIEKFSVGAEYASIQASSRLAAAERKIEEDLARSTICEKDLLAAEKDNVIRVGKETTNNNIDPEFVQEEMKKFEDNKVDPPEQNIEEIKVTVKANSSEEDIKDPSTGVLIGISLEKKLKHWTSFTSTEARAFQGLLSTNLCMIS